MPFSAVEQTNVLPGGLVSGAQEVVAFESTSDTLTEVASGTQSTALLLTSRYNRVTTVASAGDAVRLPPALAGMLITVWDGHSSNSVKVFPSSAAQGGVTGGDAINAAGANAAYTITAAYVATFRCVTTGQWYAQQAALS